MSKLVRLYPAGWRARYGAEFEELLAERPPTGRDLLDIVVGAIDARVSPQLRNVPSGQGVALTNRLAGFAAVAGGLTFSVALLALLLGDVDVTLPVLGALGLMLLSLPGRYLRPYAGRVVLAMLAVGVCVGLWFEGTMVWNWVVGPISVLTVLGAIGPGALALAATRAGISVRTRWRLVLATVPTIAMVVLGFMGVLDGLLEPVVAVASTLPLGLAWIVAGWRIAHAHRTTAIAGGTA
ncbi:MAG: hypothetical protein ABIR64_05985 [Candidatus Limnocylindrales bacterium]